MSKLALALPGGYNVSDPTGFKFSGGTIGDIVNAIIPYFFAVAGFALLLYLVWGGFEWMTSAGNEEGIKKAQAKVTAAIVGFLIVFAAYWLVQILEAVLGIKIFA